MNSDYLVLPPEDSVQTIDYLRKYSDQLDAALNIAKQYLGQTDWTIVSDENGIVTCKKNFPDICPIDCYKITATINKSHEELLQKIWNLTEEQYKEFDRTIVHLEKHKTGNNWKLMTIRSELGWPIMPRETLGIQIIKRETSNIWLVSISVDDDEIPYNKNKVVRTKMHLQVNGFEDLGNNRTKYTKVVHLDPKGDIPPIIINMFVQNFSHIINKLRE